MPHAIEKEEEILQVLEQILRVVSLQVGADKGITERAKLLKLAGLDNATIANVLNTTPATVRTLTTGLRTRKPAKSRKSRTRS